MSEASSPQGSLRAPLILVLAGMAAMAAAMGVGRFLYTPVLPYMEEALGLPKDEAGLIASANYLGYLLGALAAAKSLLPGSRRAWFLLALLVSAATTAAMGLVDSLTPFLILRFLGGLASAFVLVFSSALILERLAAAGRPQLSAVHFGGVGTGIALSALMVWWLGANGAGWRELWFGGAVLTLLALLLCWRAVPSAPEAPPPPKGAGGLSRALRALILAYGLFGFGYVITATFLSTLVREEIAVEGAGALVWAVVGLTAAPSVAFWAWLARRLGADRAFSLACLVEAAGVALSVVAGGLPGLVLSAVLLGGTFMGITALGLIHARQLSSGDPRRSLALMTAAFGLGQMIGPVFAGYLYSLQGDFTAATLTATGLLLVAALLLRRS
ncbi:MAG: YbfB/YjiJ family MFS transporter [Limibacillus sp.]